MALDICHLNSNYRRNTVGISNIYLTCALERLFCLCNLKNEKNGEGKERIKKGAYRININVVNVKKKKIKNGKRELLFMPFSRSLGNTFGAYYNCHCSIS